MESAIKILHIFGTTLCGGTEKRTLEIMQNIDRNKYRFDFCSLVAFKGDLDLEIEALGGKIFYISRRKLNFTKKFLKLLKDEQYDIVHSHVYPFSGYISYLAFKAHIPKRIVHFHSSDKSKKTIIRKIYREIMNKYIHKYATNVIAVSQSTMNAVWKKKSERCQVIYDCIDLRINYKQKNEFLKKELGIPENYEIIIHVGNMLPVKNHAMILKIFYEMQLLNPKIYLLLVGKKYLDIEKNLRKKIKLLNIEEKVIIAGFRQDVPELLAISNLFIFPSFFEGLPGAVLEACVANLPVLASNIEPVKEIAEHVSSIRCMSLSDLAKEWAKEALEMLQNKPNVDLSNTPFSLQKNIKVIENFYSARKGATGCQVI